MAEPPVLKAARRGNRYVFQGVFAPVKALLRESDYVIGNLEPPLAGKEAGADAVVATHSHIPQKFAWNKGIPWAYCLGNFNMNPKSYLAMPEILTDYGYALHLYVEEKKIVKVAFSMMQNRISPDGQIVFCPVDELCKTLKKKRSIS